MNTNEHSNKYDFVRYNFGLVFGLAQNCLTKSARKFSFSKKVAETGTRKATSPSWYVISNSNVVWPHHSPCPKQDLKPNVMTLGHTRANRAVRLNPTSFENLDG